MEKDLWKAVNEDDHLNIEATLKEFRSSKDEKGLADIYEVRNKFKETPLFSSVARNCSNCVTLLLNLSNVDVEAKNLSGDTVLHVACRKSCSALVKYLLSKDKGLINIPNNQLITPLQVAIDKDNFRLVKILVDNGADVNINSIAKMSIEQNCDIDIIMCLLTCGHLIPERETQEFNVKIWQNLCYKEIPENMKILYFKKIFGFLNPQHQKGQRYKIKDVLPISAAIPCLANFFIENDKGQYKYDKGLMERMSLHFGTGFELLYLLLHDDIRNEQIEATNLNSFIRQLLDLSKMVENDKQFVVFLDYLQRTRAFFMSKIDKNHVQNLFTNFGNIFQNVHRFIRLLLSLNFSASQLFDCFIDLKTANCEFVLEVILPYTSPELLLDPRTVAFIKNFNHLYLPLKNLSTTGSGSQLITLKRISKDKIRDIIFEGIHKAINTDSEAAIQKREIGFQIKISRLDIPQRLIEFLRLIFV